MVTVKLIYINTYIPKIQNIINERRRIIILKKDWVTRLWVTSTKVTSRNSLGGWIAAFYLFGVSLFFDGGILKVKGHCRFGGYLQ